VSLRAEVGLTLLRSMAVIRAHPDELEELKRASRQHRSGNYAPTPSWCCWKSPSACMRLGQVVAHLLALTAATAARADAVQASMRKLRERAEVAVEDAGGRVRFGHLDSERPAISAACAQPETFSAKSAFAYFGSISRAFA